MYIDYSSEQYEMRYRILINKQGQCELLRKYYRALPLIRVYDSQKAYG